MDKWKYEDFQNLIPECRLWQTAVVHICKDLVVAQKNEESYCCRLWTRPVVITEMDFTVPTVQQNGKLEPSTLSLSIPDSTRSCTPALANRGYSGALYRFSMNHWQRSLPTEMGAKCNLISACINHPVLFFGCTICLKQCWFRGRCTVPPKIRAVGGKEGGQMWVSRTIRTKQIAHSFFSVVHFFFANSYGDSWGITHN